MPHIHVQRRPKANRWAPVLAIIILLLLLAAVWYFFFGPGMAYLPADFPRIGVASVATSVSLSPQVQPVAWPLLLF